MSASGSVPTAPALQMPRLERYMPSTENLKIKEISNTGSIQVEPNYQEQVGKVAQNAPNLPPPNDVAYDGYIKNIEINNPMKSGHGAAGHIRRNAFIMIGLTCLILFILFCLLITGTHDGGASFYGFFVTMFIVTIASVYTSLDNRGSAEELRKNLKIQ